MANNENNNQAHNEVSREDNLRGSMDQLVQVLLDTQTRMEQMEQRMNDLVNQLRHGHEDSQSSPHHKTEPKTIRSYQARV